MEQFDFITKLLGMKDQNITIKDVVECRTHKEILASLDDTAPPWPTCKGKIGKYDFQKASKIPYLEVAGYKILIRLRKRRFRGKMAVADPPSSRKIIRLPLQ